MKKTLGWIGLLVMGTGMMVAPAMANGREDTHYRLSKTTNVVDRDHDRRDLGGDRDHDRNRNNSRPDNYGYTSFVNTGDNCVRR